MYSAYHTADRCWRWLSRHGRNGRHGLRCSRLPAQQEELTRRFKEVINRRFKGVKLKKIRWQGFVRGKDPGTTKGVCVNKRKKRPFIKGACFCLLKEIIGGL